MTQILDRILWKLGLMRANRKHLPPAPLAMYEWRPLCIVYVACGGKYLSFMQANNSTPAQIDYVLKMHGLGANGESKQGQWKQE